MKFASIKIQLVL